MGLSIHKLQYFGKNKKKRRGGNYENQNRPCNGSRIIYYGNRKTSRDKSNGKKEDDITITRMDILNHTGEEMIGKTMGTYITIDAPMLSDFDDDYHEKYRSS